jgi:hypothetical protein
MKSVKLVLAIRELARLPSEFAELTDRDKKSLGPPDFMQSYIADLKRRIAQLESEIES